MDIVSENKMFDGVQGVYKHKSRALKCSMNFAVFMPNTPRNTQIPVLWFLSGLTCTHENAMLKAGMQKFAQLHKIAVVFPDTSPRGKNIPDDDSYDLGQGAGFYLNATQSPWKENYQMWDYLISELPSVIEKNFNVYHICFDPIFDSYSDKMWPELKVEKITNNTIKYFLSKTYGKTTTLVSLRSKQIFLALF